MSDASIETDLPEGWAGTTVGEVSTQIQYGYTASASTEEKGPKFLRITDIQDGLVDWNLVPSCKITSSDIEKFALAPGDIVFARTGATTGKSYLIRSCPPSVFASYLIRLRPKPPLDPRFLSLFFQTPDYWQLISENVSGNAQPNCNASKLGALPMPLPPLAEQKRIVAKVETLLARVNAARQRLAKVPALLKRFRQSVLAAACSGQLTEDWREASLGTETAHQLLESIRKEKEHLPTMTFRRSFPEDNSDEPEETEIPDSWLRVKLCEICSHIADIDHKMPKAVEAGVKFLSAKDLLDDGTLNFTDNIKMISEDDYKRLARKIMPKRDDIIYSRIGACLGKSRLVETDERFLVSYSCCVIRPIVLNPAYLNRFLDSGAVLKKARTEAKSIGVPDLGLSEISQFRVPLPPLSEQHEIVRRVEALLARSARIEKRLATATRRVEALTQAILAQAFRGELVPTEAELARREGRSYEPASVLLDRIRAHTENKTTNGSGRKSRRTRPTDGAANHMENYR